jgi:hypothetical protein
MNTRETAHQAGKLSGSRRAQCRKNSRNQIRLEFVQINIERPIEAERCSDGRNNLSNESVQVCEARRRDIKVLFANIINSFVVHLNHYVIDLVSDIYKPLYVP